MRRHTRAATFATVVVLVGGLTGQVPALAAPPFRYTPPTPQVLASVPEGRAPARPARPADASAAAALTKVPAVTWPAAGTGTTGIQVLDHASAVAAHQMVLLRAKPAGGGAAPARVHVSVDYSGFQHAYGADWSTRLRLVQLPECATTTPEAAGCRPKPLASTNNTKSRTVSADVAPSTLLAVTAGSTLATRRPPARTVPTRIDRRR